MNKGAPEIILMEHDDYHAKYVGHAADGRQFFLTQPFVPAIKGEGREFLALYLFDVNGILLAAKIDDLGTRNNYDKQRALWLLEERFEDLGEFSRGRIRVAPFRIERFGIEFGLIPHPPENDDGHWQVIVEPGNYLAFIPPWDGSYDT